MPRGPLNQPAGATRPPGGVRRARSSPSQYHSWRDIHEEALDVLSTIAREGLHEPGEVIKLRRRSRNARKAEAFCPETNRALVILTNDAPLKPTLKWGVHSYQIVGKYGSLEWSRIEVPDYVEPCQVRAYRLKDHPNFILYCKQSSSLWHILNSLPDHQGERNLNQPLDTDDPGQIETSPLLNQHDAVQDVPSMQAFEDTFLSFPRPLEGEWSDGFQ